MALSFGGKSYLAKKIIALFPPRCKKPNKPDPKDDGWLHLVEPYCGGCAVSLAVDPEGISQVINDTNGDLINFWRVLQRPDLFAEFLRIEQATPFGEPEFKWAGKNLKYESEVIAAHAFFIYCRQSLAGRMKGFSGVTKTRCRQGMNGEVAAWLSAVDGLPEVHAVVRRWLIFNRPAIKVIKKQDGKRTLFYVDCPYLHQTRVTTTEYGEQEMGYADHEELLKTLADIKGRFLLSGYRSELYDAYAEDHDWKRHDFQIANHASGKKIKQVKTESVWCNY